MVTLIVRHTFKDLNVFSSRVLDWIATLKPDRGWDYIMTYNAWPVKNEAWCIWKIANPMTIPDFAKEFNKAIGDTGTAEPTWVTEFTPDTFPPFQYVPKK